MPSSPSRPPAAEEVSDAEMSDGEVLPRQAAEDLFRGAANRAAPGSAGEEDEEIYDDDESSDYNSYDDDESDESGSYYEDHEEEEEEGAGGDRASGSAEAEAASAGVGGGPKAEGSPRAAASCCICMDPWASYGAHRICCIPCGHVYGRSCLERWLRHGGNTSAKCPQCGERFKHRHIINLYSSVHLWNDCCLKEAALDDRVVVGMGPKAHDRQPVLDAVVTPSISYTQLQATDPSLSQRTSMTMTSAQSHSLLAERHYVYMEYTRQETMALHVSLLAMHEHNTRMMTHVVECMAAGRVPQLQPAPSPPPQPVLLTFGEFLAQHLGPSPGTGGSFVGGGAGWGITPEPRSPVTPIHRGGGGLGSSAAASSDGMGFGGLGGDDLGGGGGRLGA
ncbi:hypothetical protein ACQJBY_053119 [Aegilops geniculata]